MHKYIASHYNILIPVPEANEYLLYNTLSGGLEILEKKDGELLEALNNINGKTPLNGLDEDVIAYLHEKGYLTRFEDQGKEVEAFHKSYLQKRDAMRGPLDAASIGLTVTTTMNCNMGCPYCFEYEKPNKTLKSDENIQHILNYLNDMMGKAPVKKWDSFNLTWYGGEPLINKYAISALSPKLIKLCEEKNIEYKASIITNGILLTDEAWEILKTNKVGRVQVTLDGPAVTHDKYRPLKNAQGKNYYRILENLANVPDGITLVIRINVDREIANNFNTLFDDLKQYNIWPQKYRSVRFDPAWLRSYTWATEGVSKYLDVNEFFDAKQLFRSLQISLFNDWATKNGLKNAKYKFTMPERQTDCGTWVSPYNLVIDPEGYVQKCWETIHLPKEHIHHVSEGYKPELFDYYLNYDRFDVNQQCYSCKYLPVCDQLSCSHQAIEYKDDPPCTYWKAKTPSALKDQYLYFKSNPDKIAFPEQEEKFNMGHANK